MKIILFGSTGLLGNYVKTYLSRYSTHKIICIDRNIYDILSLNKEKLISIIEKQYNEDNNLLIINCANFYDRKGTHSVTESIIINSLFPNLLDNITYELNIPYIQTSTVGVFNGERGFYRENEIQNATTIYGITKTLGEKLRNATIIRLNILGENNIHKEHIIEWLKNNKKVNGFINHKINAISCLEASKYIYKIIENKKFEKKIINLGTEKIYTRYDILHIIKDIYKLQTEIEKKIVNNMDLTILGDEKFPDLYKQLYEQKIYKKMIDKKKGKYSIKDKCRFCDNENMKSIEYGDIYALAGGFIDKKEDIELEEVYPLTLLICWDCKYMQCREVIQKEILFGKYYYYYSSMIPSIVKHFEKLSEYIEKKYEKNIKIVEIGCNDGVLLNQLYKKDYKNLIGIEPSQTIENVNKEIKTYRTYFNNEITDKIGEVDLIIACNCFAHIDDMKSVINNMKLILKKGGHIIIEVHDSIKIFEEMNLDFVYHEHMGYYTVTSMNNICKMNRLNLINAEKVDNHGGTIRYTITNQDEKNNIEDILEEEKKIFSIEYIEKYKEKKEKWREDILDIFLKYKKEGYKVYGYGASGRANTIIGYCGLEFDCIIDDAKSKIGNYTPLFNTIIQKPEDVMYKDEKMCIFILVFPYKDYIINKHKEYKGVYVVPLPEIKIIEKI